MKNSIKNFYQNLKTDPDKYLLGLLVFLLPFERIPSFHTHGITFRLSMIVGAVVILRAAWLLVTKKRTFKLGWPARLLMLFLLWLCLIIPAAINIKRALEVTGFTAYVIFLAFAIVALLRKEYLPLIIKSLLYSALIVSLFGVYQFFANFANAPQWLTGLRDRYSWQIFGYPRIQSTALEPLYFASYLLLPLAVSLATLLFEPGRQVSKRLAAAVLLVGSFDLFLTVSRGGLYAYLFILVVVAAVYFLIKKLSWKRFLKTFGIILLAFVLAYAVIVRFSKDSFLTKTKTTGSTSYVDQITNTKDLTEEAADTRATARRDAIKVFKQSPIFGNGPGQFGPIISGNQPDPSGGWLIVNNEPLELLAETGIIGFGIILSFFVTLFWQGIGLLRKRDWKSAEVVVFGLLLFLAAEALQYQTFSTLYITHIWVAIGLLMALIASNNKIKAK